LAAVDDPELAMQFVPVKGLFVGRLAAAFCNWLAIPGTEAKLTDPFLTRADENCPMIVEICADDENAVEEAPVAGFERHKFIKKSGVKSAKMTLVLDRIPKFYVDEVPV